ncbi:MAG: hypothetical protein Kow0010_23240 [Dehalococcoidia bacterium]
MTRSPGRGAFPGAARNQRPWLRLVVLAAIVLGAAALVWWSVNVVFGGGSCNEPYCETGADFPMPANFERQSAVFEFNQAFAERFAGSDVQIQLRLDKKVDDGTDLQFLAYDFETREWKLAAAATLDPSGESVSGIFAEPPNVIAVFRQSRSTRDVVAYVDAALGATLHPAALQHATIVHTRDFTPNADGTVAGSPSNVPVGEGVRIIPVISASRAIQDTIPNVQVILLTPEGRSKHVQEIVRLVVEHDLPGIDLAYFDLTVDQRTSFTLLVKELAAQLHSRGKVLTLTLPPPLKAPDRIDEGAYDWAQLSEAADLIKIAPYRDQGTYRLAMVDILDHLVTVADPRKLVLTVTPYAAEKSPEGIRRLTLADAMAIATKLALRSEQVVTDSDVRVAGVNIDASENLPGIRWDPNTATVAFAYKPGGDSRTVWIENVFSVGFKLELITTFGLGGVAVEDASDNVFLGDIWPPIVSFVESGRPSLVQPNPEDLRPRWSAEAGTLSGGESGVVTWHTPSTPGTYRVFLTLSDGLYLFQSEIAIVVQTPAAAEAASQ